MAINPDYTMGGKLLGIHDEGIQIELHPDVLKYREALRANVMDGKRWLDYAVSLSDYHWINREAVNAVGLAIALDPFVPEFHFFRGYCHQKLGLLEEAAADFELCWKLDGNHQNAGYYLGMTYFYLGEYERAVRVYRRLALISPPEAEWAAICNWHYLTCRHLGLEAEARAALERITPESKPTEAVGTLGNVWDDAYYLIACQMYHGWLTPEEAIAKAAEKDEDALRAVTQFAAIYCDVNGDAQSALKYYQASAERAADPNSVSQTRIVRPRIAALRRQLGR